MTKTCGFDCLILVLLLYFLDNLPVFAEDTDTVEYCIGEDFEAVCNDDEIISIQKAVYGFMKLGRCMEDDPYGFLGCASDQRKLLDKKCSGLRHCSIPVVVADKDIDAQIPCPRYYLEAEYVCQKVIPVKNLHCNSPVHVKAESSPTYVSSLTSKETSCGLGSAPWVISAEKGQTINITLIDFSWGDASMPNDCELKYGHILMYDADDIIEICRGRSRESSILVTSSHQVQVVIDESAVQQYNFLLKFEALGCPDVTPPPNAWLQKEGNEVTVGCHTSSETWQMKCVAQHWIGAPGNCSSDKFTTPSLMTTDAPTEFTTNHVLAVGIGCLTLIICCLTITLGAYYVRRYRIKMAEQVKSQMCLLPKSSNTNTIISIKPQRDTISKNSRPITQATTLPWVDMASSGISASSIPDPFFDDPRNRGPQTLPPRNTHESGYGNLDYNPHKDEEEVKYYVLEKPPGYNDGLINT